MISFSLLNTVLKNTTLILMLFLLAVPAFAEEYIDFDLESKYVVEGQIEMPATLEATVLFQKSFQGRGGVIIGNYINSTSDCLNFEIHNNGNPRVFMVSEGESYDIIFKDVNVRTGKPMHLVLTIDLAGREIILYADGEKVGREKLKSLPESIALNEPFSLGGDNRSGNAQYFKGKLYNVALYSDIKTAEEIAAAKEGLIGGDSLIAGWNDLSGDTISDISPNGHNIKITVNEDWSKEGGYKGDYAYSFALIGDTQSLNYNYPQKFHMLYDWIIDNVESKKMKFVFGLGDITDKDNYWEWALAKQLINKMNGVVLYSLVRGNHDGIQKYNETFPIDEYSGIVDEAYDMSLLNSYKTFEVGNIKYLVLNLDFVLRDDVLEWADKVITSHPDRNVIIATHIYLHSDGTTVDKSDPTPATKYGSKYASDRLCNEFIKKYENIKMVISGHRPCDNIVVTYETGDNGNKFAQILVDPQSIDVTHGPSGMVAMLYFSEDGKTVSTEFYSTVKDKFYCNDDNVFTFDVEVIGENPSASYVEEVPAEEPAPEKKDISPWVIGSVAAIVIVLVGFLLGFIIGKKKKA